MPEINLQSRGKSIKKLPKSLVIGQFDTGEELKALISEETGLSVNQIRLSVPLADKRVEPGKKVAEQVIKDDQPVGDLSPEYILVKDLGPQVSWRLVYFIEYLLPLIINPVIFTQRKLIYGQNFHPTSQQALVFGFVMLHFLKREFETIFVHKFSLATMPLRNLFRNSLYYGIFAGLSLAYFSYGPSPDSFHNPIQRLLFSKFIQLPTWTNAFFGILWLFAELSNFRCHVILSDLRTPGSTKRAIPHGFAFELVSCPNYFFESVSWLAVAMLTQNWAAWVFLFAGTWQMFQWAVIRHKRYHREFINYPKNRKIYFPYLL